MQRLLAKIAVVGLPNAGKSTLVNAIVGRKVSIVSQKAHTTRSVVMAVLTANQSQLVFYDTPGVVSQNESRQLKLPRPLIVAPRTAMQECTQTMLVLDTQRAQTENRIVLPPAVAFQNHEGRSEDAGSGAKLPTVLVLNKVDSLKHKPRLLEFTKQAKKMLHKTHDIKQVFFTSATKGDGVQALRSYLMTTAQPGDWLFKAGEVVNGTVNELILEFCREQLYRNMNKEIPYQTHLTIINIDNGQTDIKCRIKIEAKNRIVQSMIVGSGGERLKRMVAFAEANASECLGKPVKLFWEVKARKPDGPTK